VTFTDTLRKYLGKKGFDPLMGASDAAVLGFRTPSAVRAG
jgi:hypothetical protein